MSGGDELIPDSYSRDGRPGPGTAEAQTRAFADAIRRDLAESKHRRAIASDPNIALEEGRQRDALKLERAADDASARGFDQKFTVSSAPATHEQAQRARFAADVDRQLAAQRGGRPDRYAHIPQAAMETFGADADRQIQQQRKKRRDEGDESIVAEKSIGKDGSERVTYYDNVYNARPADDGDDYNARPGPARGARAFADSIPQQLAQQRFSGDPTESPPFDPGLLAPMTPVQRNEQWFVRVPLGGGKSAAVSNADKTRAMANSVRLWTAAQRAKRRSGGGR